ncbi:lactococcin 972 family bacteriocin [Corynebacterium sp.]|uniref:lactococcin 972 family bacteriocin n=1 Tax=Corynebacterium sp. TaxID=1720 RepID=UPI0034C64712
MKRTLSIVAATAATLSIMSAAPAMAIPASGGDWVYGSNNSRVWSNYWHPSVWHASSVQGLWRGDSGCQPPHAWANSSAPGRWWAADHSYYRFC